MSYSYTFKSLILLSSSAPPPFFFSLVAIHTGPDSNGGSEASSTRRAPLFAYKQRDIVLMKDVNSDVKIGIINKIKEEYEIFRE